MSITLGLIEPAHPIGHDDVVNADDLRAALRQFDEDITAAHQRHDEAIARARREGMSQKEVIEVTGYSREKVRTIERRMGIEPARRPSDQ